MDAPKGLQDLERTIQSGLNSGTANPGISAVANQTTDGPYVFAQGHIVNPSGKHCRAFLVGQGPSARYGKRADRAKGLKSQDMCLWAEQLAGLSLAKSTTYGPN